MFKNERAVRFVVMVSDFFSFFCKEGEGEGGGEFMYNVQYGRRVMALKRGFPGLVSKQSKIRNNPEIKSTQSFSYLLISRAATTHRLYCTQII